mgnify:CR=1 FL=1
MYYWIYSKFQLEKENRKKMSPEVTEMKCGCIIEMINGKHMITQYCPEHEEDEEENVDSEEELENEEDGENT